MTNPITVVLLISAITFFLLAFEIIKSDVLAIMLICALAVCGILDGEQAVKGFSNASTLTVMNMFIISEAVFKTGALNILTEKIYSWSADNKSRALALLLVFTGVSSMFINNTAVVAIIIPVVFELSKKLEISASKLLMPISFISMLGGACTLLGTSTNLLANGILKNKGLEAFEIFSFFEIAIFLLVFGFLYLYFLSDFFIPSRRGEKGLEDDYEMNNYISHIKVLEGSEFIGRNINDSFFSDEIGIEILSKEKKDSGLIIEKDDFLKVKSDAETIANLSKEKTVLVFIGDTSNSGFSDSGEKVLVESIIPSGSELEGRYLSQSQFLDDFDTHILAIRQRKNLKRWDVNKVRFKAGDSLLIYIPKVKIDALRKSNFFWILQEMDEKSFKKSKMKYALMILLFTVLIPVLTKVSILISSFLAVTFILLLRILSPNEAYKAVRWPIIFLLAGLIALGKAMDQSGAAKYLSDMVIDLVLPYGNFAVILCYFSLSTLLTSFMSNNASVALMVPLAIFTAQEIDIELQKLVLAVMFGASMSFLTPIGYQTNLMVYNVGHYQFKDFMRLGAPLSFLTVLLGSLILYYV